MDLNDQLRQLRKLAQKFVDNLGPDGSNDPIDPDDVYDMAVKFQELDKVIKESGVLPYEWDHSTYSMALDKLVID